MKRHDSTHASVNRRPEGDKLDAIEACRRGVDARELEMGVLLRVAVPGKVLPGGEHSIVLNAVHERRAELGDQLRILSERPEADDGILRIIVDVEHRSKRDMDAECSALAR